ncbi:MAG: PAS domain-containing sensor histidine kinase [Bacteroidota bacterium]
MKLKHAKENGSDQHISMSSVRNSEVRYRRLFETAQDGILILDGESGAITDANPYIIASLGYSLEELKGKRLWEIGAFVDVKEAKEAFEELQRKEYIRYKDLPLKTKTGQLREVEFVSNVYLVNGKKVIQCNIRDITDRKHAEDALHRSEEQYRRLFESAQDGILLLDAATGAITDANPYILQKLGYPLDDLLGKRLWEIGAFKDVKESKSAFEELQKKEYIRYEDLPLKTKDGHIREVEFVSNVYLVNGKKIIQCNIRDITDRKQAEGLLRQSEERLRVTLESTMIGNWDWDLINDVVIASPTYYTMQGWEPGKGPIDREEWLTTIHPDDRICVTEKIQGVLNGTHSEYQYEARVKHADGSYRWHNVIGHTVEWDKNHTPTRMIGVRTDITERKRAEEALQSSKSILEGIIKSIPVRVFWKDKNLTYVGCNTVFARDAGFSDPKEVIGKDDFQMGWREQAELYRSDDRRVIDSGISKLDIEEPQTTPAGTTITLLTNKIPLRNSTGEITGVLGTYVDISERKKFETALQESNDKFHQLANNITDAFWIRSPDMSEVQYISPGFEKIWGRSVESLYANPDEWTTFVHPDDRGRVNSSFTELSSGKSNLDIEYRIVRPDGDIRWVHLRGFQVRDSAGQLIRHIGIVSDITDRRRIEELLRESEEKFRTVIETLPDGFYRSTVDGRFVDVNMAMVKMLGYNSKEELLQIDIPTELYFKQEDRILAQYNQDFIGDIDSYQLKKKDGTGIWVEDRCHYLRDKSGNIKYHEGISRDITERRAAEEQQRKSEEKYRGIFENVQDVYFETSIDGTVFEVSPSISVVSKGQYAREDLLGVSMFDFYSESAERNMLIEILQKKGIVNDYEVKLKNRDGTLIPCSISAKIQFNSAGQPQKIIGSMRDITERKVAQEALRKGEERYRRLVEFSPIAIMVHRDGKFIYVNPAAVDLLAAHESSQLLGRPILDILHADHRESHRMKQSISGDTDNVLIQSKEKFLRLDGTVIDVEVVSLKIEYDGMPAMQDVVRDVSEQIKLQQQILQSQKNESIGTLAAGIAHDFNNILGIILGYTYILEQKRSDEKAFTGGIAAINQAVKRGASLVRQILTFARKTETKFLPVNSAELVNELVSMLKQTFPRIIEINNQFPTHVPFILADRTQIHQTILNLCVNARDAMPNGGSITLTATEISGAMVKNMFRTADQQSYLCVGVTDTGEGMTDAIRARIFDPFFTTKPQGKGTGLGLPVVIGIVQAHHGFINVESVPDKGTTFRIYLPTADDAINPADAHREVPFTAGGQETILLVEDEELLLNAVELLLESNGYTVFIAHDGAEAVESYTRHQSEIDLVVTDLGLPVMTGMEEFKKLKEINPDITVIFASGFIDPDIKSELLIAGARYFLQKPYVADEILKIIREALDKKPVR